MLIFVLNPSQMKKNSFFLALIIAAFFSTTSCKTDFRDTQGDLTVESPNSYMQVEGGERFIITKAVKTNVTTGNATTPNVVKLAFTGQRAGTQEFHTATFVISYPFNKDISGAYSTLSSERAIDKDASLYSSVAGTVISGPFSNLTHGALQISASGENTYSVVFSMSPTYGPKPITGKFNGAFSGN